MTAASETWAAMRELPLTIDSLAFERRSRRLAQGFERVTTLVRLRGAGVDGVGEDVSCMGPEEATLHVAGPELPLEGEWTLESFCDHLAGLDQWSVAPEWPAARRYRNWAFESAALDLALAQAGRPLHEVLGREPRPVRFVNSLGLGDPPTFEPIRRRLEVHPDVRFKVDVTPAWTPELIDEVAATGAVEIVDFKGHYGREPGELPELLAMYDHAIAAFGDALLEDAHDIPEVAERLAGEAHRISYDAPIHTVEDIGATPLEPRALNIKPCRVGDLRSLLDVYAECDARGLLLYGGGMGELDAGRGQIQLLAALFHPDGPNDTAPAGYNEDTPAADLPGSPLPADPAPVGFRRG